MLNTVEAGSGGVPLLIAHGLFGSARNFNTMADEISTLLANRTTLMAGISHDL